MTAEGGPFNMVHDQKRGHTPGLKGFWDESQTNKANYSAFWSVDATMFKNVISLKIFPQLFLSLSRSVLVEKHIVVFVSVCGL